MQIKDQPLPKLSFVESGAELELCEWKGQTPEIWAVKGTDSHTGWVIAPDWSFDNFNLQGLMLLHPAPHLPRMSRRHYICMPSDTFLQRNCAVNAVELITEADGLFKKNVFCDLHEGKVVCEPHLAFASCLSLCVQLYPSSGAHTCLCEHAMLWGSPFLKVCLPPRNLTIAVYLLRTEDDGQDPWCAVVTTVGIGLLVPLLCLLNCGHLLPQDLAMWAGADASPCGVRAVLRFPDRSWQTLPGVGRGKD